MGALPSARHSRADAALRVTSAEWRRYLSDPRLVAAYHGRIYRRPGQCWHWLGAVSQDGQAKIRVPRDLGNRVLAAPVLGYQLAKGPIPRTRDGSVADIRHICDEPACQNPAHWIPGTRADNAEDYTRRKADPLSPLNDLRGPGGRARAIRDAIVAARDLGADAEGVEAAIARAIQLGSRGTQDKLF